MEPQNKYIIYTPVYKDNSGGRIVLHKLCSMLVEMGCDAKIWPRCRPVTGDHASRKGVRKYLRWYLKHLPKHYLGILDMRSPYNLALAEKVEIDDSIVIYPEVVSGNPLGATKVVRWLLNKPGALKGTFEFGSQDLLFFYNEQFNDWDLNPNKDNQLRVVELMRGIYKNNASKARRGTCYIVRKGKHRKLDQHDDAAIKVDGLRHHEMAGIFNRCQYFVSYDLYTMYSRYAAMCGCIPVVIPEEGLSKEQWRPEVENRYGIAYGWEDIPWALATREKLLDHLREVDHLSLKSVENFVAKTREHFSETSL